MNKEHIGQRIARRRKALGMTQRELGEKLHVTDRAVSRWERGIGGPDLSLLVPLAALLETTTDQLLTGETPPSPSRQTSPPPVEIPYFYFRLYRIVGWVGVGIMVAAAYSDTVGLSLPAPVSWTLYLIGILVFLVALLVLYPLFYRCPGCGRILGHFRPKRTETQHCSCCGKALRSDHSIASLSAILALRRRAQ